MVLSIYRAIALAIVVLRVAASPVVDPRSDIPEEVEAINESPPTPVVEPPTPPSAAASGVITPQPTQPGMVGNCNKFYFVQPNQGCTEVALNNGITFAQLLEWNTGIGAGCTGLWANVNVCVGVIVTTPTPTPSSSSSTPTPTPSESSSSPPVTPSPTLSSSTSPTTPSPTNSISTPLPTQPGMVGNCVRFYFVNLGDTCQGIADRHTIQFSDLLAWNPTVGSTCSGLWANVYVCVLVSGYTTPTPTPNPPPTSTQIGNGVVTPTPTQPGMVTNCNNFYFVKTGDTCAGIAAAHGIPVGTFVGWNPAVRSDCTGMWSNTWVCVWRGSGPYTSTRL